MVNVAPISVSRSAIVTRKLCEMKRYRNYHQPHPDAPSGLIQVGGLTPVQDKDASHLAKQRGIWLHGCMEQLLKGNDWEAWLAQETAPQLTANQVAGLLTGNTSSMIQEQILLVRRAVIGWVKQRGHLLDQYTPISSEDEWTWSMSPFIAQTLRMDQIWRRKSDGQLLIVDFKTLGRVDANWIDRLRNSDQTHLYIQALTERTGERIGGIQYEGIVIGKFENGVQKSTFTGGYTAVARLGVTAKWRSGASWVPTDMWTDDQWLEWADKEGVLTANYITTGPLNPPQSQLLQTKAATVQAELEWADKIAQIEAAPDDESRDALISRLVERNADACLKFGMGYACPYMDLCWNGAQPDADSFDPRVDHHATEDK